MKIRIALAPLNRSEFPLQRRVQVLDIETFVHDVDPIGQCIQNAQQPRTVGRQLLGQ